MPNKIINYIPEGISRALQEDPANPFALSYVRQRFNAVVPDEALKAGWAAMKKHFEETELPKGVTAKLASNSVVPNVEEHAPTVEQLVAVPMRFKERVKLKLYGFKNVTVNGVMHVPEDLLRRDNVVEFETWLKMHRNSERFTTGTVDDEPGSVDFDYAHTVEIDTVDSDIDGDIDAIMTAARAAGAERTT